MFTLKYVPGALPGKALKRKISAEEIRNYFNESHFCACVKIKL
jgi:hypothetical protein